MRHWGRFSGLLIMAALPMAACRGGAASQARRSSADTRSRAFTPDSDLLPLNTSRNTLSVVDPEAQAEVMVILTGRHFPMRIRLRPLGTELLVSNGNAGEVVAIGLEDWQMVRRPPVGGMILIPPADRVAYVANIQDGMITPVDLAVGGGRDWVAWGRTPEGGEDVLAAGPDGEEWGSAEKGRVLRPRDGTDEDWERFRQIVSWAWEEGLDTLSMGESMARIGLRLVGTPYAPHTLELPGREGVVVNLMELDCVTFVENVLALSRFIRLAHRDALESDPRFEELYRHLLAQIRYRGGRVDGYASRLHYFSEWIRDNEKRGIVKDLTRQLGGIPDNDAINFISRHADAYRQASDPVTLRAIEETEVRISGQPRFRIPEADVAVHASGIQDGDIIAATSAVEGLDVAHTGLALWRNGELHLLNAPLVGGAVEVSRVPLAARLRRLRGQNGIEVARPLSPWSCLLLSEATAARLP